MRAAMRAAVLLLAAASIHARPHGADVAAFVRDRRRHLNATDEEGDHSFAGTYQCPEAGEAYSAAFLCRKAVFLKHLVPETRLHKGVGNMEGASNYMFKRNRLLKTVDLFDFFVEHLSWYERRLFKDASLLRDTSLARIKTQTFHRTKQVNPSGQSSDKVVVIMPYYATKGGDSGHSALESRRIYLRKTVESLKPTFPHYTVCVATKPDYEYVTDPSNELGFYDVLHYYTLPKPSRLGFATVHTAQQAMLNNPKWSRFEYVFYTESDQILHVRDVNRLLHIASSEVPNHVLPHRISPVPRRVDMGPEPFEWGNGRALGVAAGTKAMAEFARNAPIYARGGDLIVLAPVSAGAELLADGHIHVYGPLRGRALAGVTGDRQARIFCQSLEAELVSIAGQYKVAEDLRKQQWKAPVQISLEGDSLKITGL